MTTGDTALIDPAAIGRGFAVIMHADLVAKILATVATFEAHRDLRGGRRVPTHSRRVRPFEYLAPVASEADC